MGGEPGRKYGGDMSRSPPRPSSNHEQLVLALAEGRSLIRARDLRDAGVPSMVLSRMVRAGRIQRVGHGIYAPRVRDVSEHLPLAEVCMRAPRAVVCLLSALRFHEVGTQDPHDVWIAVPSNAAAPRIDSPAVRITRMSEASLSDGIVRHEIDGVGVPVFSVAKTIADCFKYRGKVGLDVAIEALREGWALQAFTTAELRAHARIARVENVMRPYVECVIG